MQVVTELPQKYVTELAKLNELLRLYLVSKKSQRFSQVMDKTKQKINKIISTLRYYPCFQEVEDDVLTRVEKTFQEVVKSSRAPSEKSSSKQSISSIHQDSKAGSEKLATSVKPNSSPIKKSSSVQIQEPKSSKNIALNRSQQVAIKNQPAPEEESQSKPKKPVISAMELITPQGPERSDSKGNESGQGLFEINSESQVKGKNMPTPIEQKKEFNMMKESISSIKSGQNNPQSESFFLLQSATSMEEEKQKKEQKVKRLQRNNSNNSSNLPSSKEEDVISQRSSRFSEVSYCEDAEEMITRFLSENRDKLNSTLILNNQLFQNMDKSLDNHFYLFGVNKPENINIKEIYGCTLMKFLTVQLYKSQSKFEKEIKDFSQNIRVPLGLIFKGEPRDITPEHIKFLLTLKSPFPVVLVVKDDEAMDGWICSFSDTIIESIRVTPRKDLGNLAEELKKKSTIMKYSQQNFPQDKNKVTTKYLQRQIPSFPEEAPNAITISGNECIREQKNCFSYKLHMNYFKQMKNNQILIYYVNNNILNARKLFQKKDFDVFKKTVLQSESKVPMILGFSVTKETIPIRKQFFQVLLLSKDKRDPFFLINSVALTVKKSIVAILSPDVTMDKINSMNPLAYKDLEKDTSIITLIHHITKSNIKEFETQGKEELISVQK